MIDFSDKTTQGILNKLLNKVPDTLDKRPGSFVYIALAAVANVMYGVYFTMDMIQKYTFVTFAIGDYLDYRCAERGLSRKPASAAVRKVYFNIEIEDTSARFSTVNAQNSLIYKIGNFITEEEGLYYYEAICETVGNVGNGYIGAIQPINLIEGLDVAQMTDILVPGTEQETDEQLRERYIESLKEKPFAGNIASYREFVLSQEGTGAIQVYPIWKGGGTVLCSILDAEYNPASPTLLQKIQKELCPINPDDNNPTQNGVGYAPIGASVTLTTATKRLLNISYKLEVKSSFDFNTVKNEAKEKIEEYFLSLRKDWDKRLTDIEVTYGITVLYTQVLANIVGTEGVLNIRDFTIDGLEDDIVLTENSSLQEIPFVGEYDVRQLTN